MPRKEVTMVMRPKELSPIYKRMMKEAGDDPAKLAMAAAYGLKVDTHMLTGEQTRTVLPYEGPCTDPLVKEGRPNIMNANRRAPMRRIYGPDGELGGGRKVVDLFPTDDERING